MFVLGPDVDATYLDEIQGIESLMLVLAHAGTCGLVGTRPCELARTGPRGPKVRTAALGTTGP